MWRDPPHGARSSRLLSPLSTTHGGLWGKRGPSVLFGGLALVGLARRLGHLLGQLLKRFLFLDRGDHGLEIHARLGLGRSDLRLLGRLHRGELLLGRQLTTLWHDKRLHLRDDTLVDVD